MANLDFCDKQNMITYLQKSEGSKGFHQIIDFLTASHIKYALTENPTIYVSLMEQFWKTATASTLEDGDIGITTTIDGKVKVVFEASIRRHLKLEDSDGISTLSTTEIFEQLALMGTAKAIPKEVSIAEPDMDVTLAEALMDLLKSGKKKSPKPKVRAKDKGKAIMTKLEKPLKKKDQIQSDEELALRLHVEEQAEFERLQKERVA
ncbi:hypothetical protein Tco_1285163 [Tanacetum coccineum]